MPRQHPRPTPSVAAARVAEQPLVTPAPRLVPLEAPQAQFRHEQDEGESRQGSSRDLDPVRRTRRRRAQKLQERQSYPACNDVGNDVLSCYPTSNTTVIQGEWTAYVWNYRYPEYIGYVDLDIYLFHADSGLQAAKWSNVPNAAGRQGVSVGDEFWGTRGVTGWTEGRNQTMPFYFVAVSAGADLNGGERRQSTFTAIQTQLPNSYFQSLASVSSTASAGSLSSLASQSSRSVESTRSVLSLTPTLSASYNASPTGASGNGSLQSGTENSPFPKWAIALLVILGTLALAALLLLAWLAARNARTRKRVTLNRRSTGSSTPISGQDAAIMASRFRAMMRKPDFANRPYEEGESPEERDAREQAEMLKEQLAEEGRDIQSVRSERGVRVHTTEDGASVEDGGWSLGHGSGTPRPGTPRR